MNQFCLERKGVGMVLQILLQRIHSPPHRRRANARHIAGRHQQLCLVGFQLFGRCARFRPPYESTLGKSLLRQPVPLAIVECAAAHSTIYVACSEMCSRPIGGHPGAAMVGIDCTFSLETFQPLQDGLAGPPGDLIGVGHGLDAVYRITLHVQIDGRVSVGRRGAGMAKPLADGCQIHT